MKHPASPRCVGFVLVLSLLCTTAVAAIVAAQADDRWFRLFNGENLDGWTVKIAGHPLGENHADTFRVEDGILKVSYDQYDAFNNHFGNLFTNVAYSDYVLRLEYKLPGQPMPDAPGYVAFNSGVMLHAQSPLSMTHWQGFPVSLEGQLLAEGTTAGSQTGNVCTVGTHIVHNGELTEAHIVESTAKLYPPDEWVRFEAEVRGDRQIIYRVNGEEVLRFSEPTLDPNDENARRLLEAGVSRRLTSGHIALQAEGHPVWFRNIEIRPLD